MRDQPLGQSIGNTDILDFILSQFDAGIVPAAKICFEVTETAAIADLMHAKRFMQQLKDRGCRFALDDFGSGFSSLAYLKHLPVISSRSTAPSFATWSVIPSTVPWCARSTTSAT